MAEAYAMRHGLALENRLGCNNVATESDLLEVIQACTGEHSWWSESSAIFVDCMDLIPQIAHVKFCFCPRKLIRSHMNLLDIALLIKILVSGRLKPLILL